MNIDSCVQELEDMEAIGKLKMMQMKSLDAAVNGESDLEALDTYIAPDFLWDCAHFGTYEGRHEYKDFIKRYAERVSFSMHFLTGSATYVSADRKSAAGEWVVWQPFTLDRKPWIFAGRSHDKFVQTNDSWLVSATDFNVEFLTPWTTGWAEDRISPDWCW